MTPIAILIYSLLSGFLVRALINSHSVDIQRMVAVVIFIHAAFLCVQLFSWYVLGVRVDYIINVTGEESRNFGGYLMGLEWFRSSGLFVEPGTFSAYMSILLLVYVLYKGRSSVTRMVGYFSILTSFSAQGALLGLFIAFLDIKINFTSKSFVGRMVVYGGLCAVALASFFISVYSRFFGEIEVEDASATARLGAFDQLLHISMLGHGFCGNLLGTGNSFFIYLYSFIGIFVAILVFPMVSVLIKNPLILFAILILFSTKIVPTSPFFWIALYLILESQQQVNLREKCHN
jgi:hypothetical protein